MSLITKASSRLLKAVSMREFEEHYGEFDKKNYDRFKIAVPNEAGFVFGEIMKWAKDIKIINRKTILLVGEHKQTKKSLQKHFPTTALFTTGLGIVDYYWDFDHNSPIRRKFDLIISQAIFEHILNPYLHLQQLARLLAPNGHLIIHTSIWESYHRYPICTFRFFPDWFEEMGKRLCLNVVKKRINNSGGLFYMYQRIEK